jgi:toxin YhaV
MIAGPHAAPNAPLVVNGWAIFAHPLFLDQVESLALEVEALRARDPAGFASKNATRTLAAITRLAFTIIPQDPTRPEYRQGNTLGAGRRHWFRAKFFQQYRLFFRQHAPSRLIVYAWVNDEGTKRAYDSSTDAYRVFRKMLDSGHPPDDWETLVAEAREVAGQAGEVTPGGRKAR